MEALLYTYIIFSEKLKQYYTGSTQNLENRLNDHNTGRGKHTAKGDPWILVFNKQCKTRTETVRLENTIKKRGAKRFLSDLQK